MNASNVPGADETTPWTPLVQRVAAGEPDACGELYSRLRSLRFFFSRRLGAQDAEDQFHDVIVALIESIQRGHLREPEKLTGYANTIAQRILCKSIEALVQSRHNLAPDRSAILRDLRCNSEEHVIRQERAAIAGRVLAAMPEREREVLLRFYVRGQDAQSIQHELSLTETQFRLIKTRAKRRYGELVQRRLASRPVVPLPQSVIIHEGAPASTV